MLRIFLCVMPSAVLLVFASVLPILAQSDLVVQKDDVSIAKSGPNNLTYVTATVYNRGASGSGSFTLRIGVSKGGSASIIDFPVTGIAGGQSASRTASFAGTAWTCGWGNADIAGEVAEPNETNNCASRNEYWISVGPGGIHNETIGVTNPGPDPELITLTPDVPPSWIVTVDPPQIALSPGEHRDAVVHFEAPGDFRDHVFIDLYGSFEDLTPGIIDWEFRMESAVPVDNHTWGAIKALFES